MNEIKLIGKIDWFCESKKSFQVTIEEEERNGRKDLSLEIYTNDEDYDKLINNYQVEWIIGFDGHIEKNEEQELIIKCDKIY